VIAGAFRDNEVRRKKGDSPTRLPLVDDGLNRWFKFGMLMDDHIMFVRDGYPMLL
jgi:hypothetical protein